MSQIISKTLPTYDCSHIHSPLFDAYAYATVRATAEGICMAVFERVDEYIATPMHDSDVPENATPIAFFGPCYSLLCK